MDRSQQPNPETETLGGRPSRLSEASLRHDPRTQAYMRRRTAQGMSKTEIVRCLKRYVAREVYSMIRKPNQIIVR